MRNFDDFIYHNNSIPKSESEKSFFFEELEKKFYNDLLTSTKTREYLNRYYNGGSNDFLKSYAKKKVYLIKHYDYYLRVMDEKETSELDYRKKADEALCAILQKKLFNLQLLWRARKLDQKNFKITNDFIYWENNIYSCPFIPLITQNEIDLMKEYLSKIDDHMDDITSSSHYWQDYKFLMETDEYGDCVNMPDWYEFYDNRMGTSSLLILPDLRGLMEKKYFNLIQEHNKQKNKPIKKPVAVVDKREHLIGFGQPLVDFSRFIENDKHLTTLFNCFEYDFKKFKERPDRIEMEYALEVLYLADRTVNFESHLNWKDAIVRAAFKYENIKTIENIDAAYDEYLLLNELGVSKGEYDKSSIHKESYIEINNIYRESILKGRELNGESDDFDY